MCRRTHQKDKRAGGQAACVLRLQADQVDPASMGLKPGRKRAAKQARGLVGVEDSAEGDGESAANAAMAAMTNPLAANPLPAPAASARGEA